MSSSESPRSEANGDPANDTQANERDGAVGSPSDNRPQRENGGNPSRWSKHAKVFFFKDANRIVALFTGGLFLIGICALSIQRDTEKRQLRAYVIVDKVIVKGLESCEADGRPQFCGASPNITAILHNAGLTPANNVRSRGRMAIEDYPLIGQFTPFDWSKKGSVEPLGPGMELGRDHSQFPPMPPGHVYGVAPGKKLYALGEVQYDDIFGTSHHTKWRFIVVSPDHAAADDEGNEAD